MINTYQKALNDVFRELNKSGYEHDLNILAIIHKLQEEFRLRRQRTFMKEVTGFLTIKIGVEEQPTERGEPKIGDLTKGEQEKYFEQHFSPLIRYGYNTALCDFAEYWIQQKVTPEFFEQISNKILEMQTSKKQVDI